MIMKKPIDIDKLFEKFMRRYVSENSGKYSEEEWYDMLPDIYAKFDNTPLMELGGVKPLEYFDDEGDLVGVWLEYIKQGIPLNDYILDAIVNRVDEREIIAQLDEYADEELLLSAVEVLRRKDSKNAVNRYIDLLFSKKICHHVKDEMVEDVISNVDELCGYLLERLDGKTADSMFAEILSYATARDERIKRMLLDGLKRGDKVAEYSAYLAHYGDENCLDEMIEYLDKVTDYVSYKELKLAIEALGGSVEADRDFSSDKDYQKIKSTKNDSDKD